MSFQKHLKFYCNVFIIEEDWVERLQQIKFENVKV
jgi:hypothetical protein